MNRVIRKLTQNNNLTNFKKSFCFSASKTFEDSENREDQEYYESSHKGSAIFRILYWSSMSLVGLNAYFLYKDTKKEERPFDIGHISYLYDFNKWVYLKLKDFKDFIVKPPSSKLLPDHPPTNPALHPKTLVLNFEGTLLSKDFEAGHGVILHLRPGFKKFIEEMSKKYEIVIFSEEDSQFLEEATQTIDPNNRYFFWVFGREFLSFDKSRYIKDIGLLNRDMKKIVIIDTDKKIYKDNIQNLILVSKYNGEEKDDSLEYLKIILDRLADPNVKDIRKEIIKHGSENYFNQFKEDMLLRANKIKQRSKYFLINNK